VHLLILVDCYLPSPKSVAKLIHDLGIEFKNQGHQVTVLTIEHDINERLQISVEDGLRIVRVRTMRIKGASRPARALNEMLLSQLVWQVAGRVLVADPADLIVFYSPTIFWGPLVRRLKSIWNCRAYLVLRDIFPESLVRMQLLGRGLIYRYFRRRELDQYSCANVIGVLSSGDLKYFADNFPQRPYQVELLYNWTPLQEQDVPATCYRSRLRLQNKIVFFFGGNFGVSQDVDNLIRLAESLKDHSQMRFLFVGEGTEEKRMKRAIADKGLSNVQLLPPMEQRCYWAMVSEFDVGLISLDRRLTTHNIPGKLLSYLYWGMPVLASVNPGNDLFSLIGEKQAGFCIANGEDAHLRAAALRLASDPELRARMGRTGRRLLEERFSVEMAAEQILRCFQASPLVRSTSLAAHS
jgi:glycosyltransferase involved in cell wall biosynthesis